MRITQIDGLSGSNATTETAWVGAPDPYDLAAEREALAVEFLQENTPRRIGRPSGSPITCIDAATAPVNADGKLVRQHRNSRAKAVKRWVELCNLLQQANDPLVSPSIRQQAHTRISALRRWNITTVEDRARQRIRRERRKALLAKLKREKARFLPFSLACRLADVAGRTLHNQCAAGRVGRIHRDGQVLVSTADLRAFLQCKIAA